MEVISAGTNKFYSSLGCQLFLMHQVKKPLLEGLQTLTDKNAGMAAKARAAKQLWRAYKNLQKLPEPTIEPGPGQVLHPNSINILRLRDWFCARCQLGGARVNFVRTGFNLAAVITEMDPPWRTMMDKTREEAFKLEWVPPGYTGEPVDYPWWID